MFDTLTPNEFYRDYVRKLNDQLAHDLIDDKEHDRREAIAARIAHIRSKKRQGRRG